jgi:hypothetical protein
MPSARSIAPNSAVQTLKHEWIVPAQNPELKIANKKYKAENRKVKTKN